MNNSDATIPVSLRRTPSKPPRTSIYDLDHTAIVEWLGTYNQPRYRAQQLIDHLYTQRKPIASMTTWPEKIHQAFMGDFNHALASEVHQVSRDKTHKWLFRLHDGKFIETVLMEYDNRATVCISSQAGCAMGCTFCATGQAGFDRHLTSTEIIEQVAHACHTTSMRVSNIVFMGMGEPLANTKNVKVACERLMDDFGFAARHITVSTVGVIPGMNDMASWNLQITLAVSLHAPFDDMRSELVPLNNRYPITDVLRAAENYSRVHSRRVSFEYAAIDHTNVTHECAHELGRILRNYSGAGGAHVNVIPLNATKGFDGKAAQKKAIETFAEIVRSYGPTVTIRRNRGVDIDAACGQLRERIHEPN